MQRKGSVRVTHAHWQSVCFIYYCIEDIVPFVLFKKSMQDGNGRRRRRCIFLSFRTDLTLGGSWLVKGYLVCTSEQQCRKNYPVVRKSWNCWTCSTWNWIWVVIIIEKIDFGTNFAAASTLFHLNINKMVHHHNDALVRGSFVKYVALACVLLGAMLIFSGLINTDLTQTTKLRRLMVSLATNKRHLMCVAPSGCDLQLTNNALFVGWVWNSDPRCSKVNYIK